MNRIDIRNYQSLRNVQVELGSFTVIVGASSSGKSAFIRALRALVSNQRGTSFITQGERSMSITAETDKGKVIFKRSTGSNGNEYIIHGNGEDSQKFTKLAGGVPDEVSAFLGISSKDPINFSSQFDKPFLLDESPAEVARILGELTNAHILSEASREANRRKLNSSGKLKVRVEDREKSSNSLEEVENNSLLSVNLDGIEAQLSEIRTIQAELVELERFRQEVATVAKRSKDSAKLSAFEVPDVTALDAAAQELSSLREAREQLKSASSRAKSTDALVAVEIPDTEDMEKAYRDIADLRKIRDRLTAELKTHKRLAKSIEDFEDMEKEATAEYEEMLKVLGNCPTCGQDTSGVGSLHEH